MRLVLHAGTHKTGTSTLQRVMFDHRETLADCGLVYPDPRPWFGSSYRAHHPVAHAVARGVNQSAVRGFLDEVRTSSPQDATVLLSAEPIYRHVRQDAEGGWWRRHQAFLRDLSALLEDFEVEVALVFRRRDTFLESVYHERVAHGFGGDFLTLRHNADRLLDYDRQLQQFEQEFGIVRTFEYEALTAEGLVEAFLLRLGIDVPQLDVEQWDRRSVDARLSLWMAASYREDPDDDLVTQRRRFSKNPVSNELFPDDWGQVTLWPDEASRRALLEEYGEDALVQDDRPAAVLTPEIEDRIDDAFDAYLVAKGLEPTNRRARRRAAS